MNKLSLVTLMTSLGIALSGCGRVADEDRSRALEEASELLQSEQKAEKTSYVDALKIYEKALAKLEETTAELNETILPEIRLKAEAEQDPLVCALLVAEKVEDPERKVRALIEIGGKYAQLGQQAQATDAFSRAAGVLRVKTRRGYSTVWTCGELADALLQAGQDGKASQIVSLALADAQAIDQPLHRARALAVVVGKLGRAGQEEEALQTLSLALKVAEALDDADHAYEKSWALADIARGAAHSGLYERAVETARGVPRAADRALAMAFIAGECIRAGQNEMAYRISSKAALIAESIDDAHWKSKALSKIASRYAQAAQYEDALGAAAAVESPGWGSVALSEILNRCESVEKKEERFDILRRCTEIAKRIDGPYRRSESLANASITYFHLAENERALEVLSDSLQVASTMCPGSEQAWALSKIAPMYAELGQKSKASQILSEALEAAEKESEPSFRADALASTAKGYARAGLYDQAIQVAKRIVVKSPQGSHAKGSAMAEIVARLAAAGQYDKALRVAAIKVSLAEPGWKDAALASVAGRLADAGQYARALRVTKMIDHADRKAGALTYLADKYAQSTRKIGPAERKILRQIVRELE